MSHHLTRMNTEFANLIAKRCTSTTYLYCMTVILMWNKQKYNNAMRSMPAHPKFVNHPLAMVFCQVWWRSTQRFSLYRVHKLISIYVNCDLNLWPLTSKINMVHSLTMANMSGKFDEEAHNGLVSIVFTSLFPHKCIVTLTFDLWPPRTLHGQNNSSITIFPPQRVARG